MDRNFRPYLVELVGTFAVVFISAGAVCVNALATVPWASQQSSSNLVIVQPEPGLIGIGLAYGLIYAVALAVTLPSAGGFLNPAVPLALWVFKRMDTGKAVGLTAVQLLGAAIAGGLLRLVFSFREDILSDAHLGTPHVSVRMFAAGVTPKMLLSGIGMELVLTFILVFILYATLIDPRAPRWFGPGHRRWGALWAGLFIVAATIVGSSLTGAALNPARWFGTVIWESTIPSLQAQRPFQDHVVYWFGPIAGALLATVLYNTLLMPEEEPVSAPHGAATATPAKKTISSRQ
jgi:glycerol uptake facilitator-like aquaporin